MIWNLTTDKTWPALEAQFSWVREMNGVPQDAIYHAEGDVATHTQMVLNELVQLEGYQKLDMEAQEILWTAALMHDIEKRSTTIIDEAGRIHSPGHAKKGEATVRELFYRNGMAPFSIREHVAKLVRYHGLPLWSLYKNDPQKAVIKASLETNTEWIALLAEADARGRKCADRDELLLRVDLFREQCRELDCYGKPRAFASELGRFLYFMKDEEATPDYEPFDDYAGEVVLLSGLPGSGKDAYIKKHYKDWPVVSLDNERRARKIAPDDAHGNGQVVQACKEQARVFLRKKQPFVWNATNITRQMRSQLVELFTTYKAKTTIVYIEVPYRELLAQNHNRDYKVPEAVMKRLTAKLEVPYPDEACAVKYVIR